MRNGKFRRSPLVAACGAIHLKTVNRNRGGFASLFVGGVGGSELIAMLSRFIHFNYQFKKSSKAIVVSFISGVLS
jgi:hypothetical protein